MRRRLFLFSAAAALAAFAWTRPRAGAAAFEITRSDDEWRKILPPDTFAVMREHDTERPWTSKLLDEHRKGTFICAACALPLFASDAKFDSGTGWPSFFDVLPDAVGRQEDNTLFVTRTEVHCRRCGGHLGHVFDDGPQPTGLRYCINGVSLGFQPATGS